MVSANDVVNFFVLNTSHPERMTNMRANKLAYYAQAWSLARLGRPLFQDKIEAWEHGPVVTPVYYSYSYLKDAPIPVPKDTSFLSRFTDDECQLLLDVAREYDCMSTWQLRNLSHSAGEPWRAVYDPDRKHIEIPPELMKECFMQFDPLPLASPLSEIPVVSSLPADWDDPSWEEYAPK